MNRTIPALAAALAVAAAVPARAFDSADATRVLDLAARQLARPAARLPSTQSPKQTGPDGSWTTVANTDLVGWTQGFYPGAMWYLLDWTGDATWQPRADAWTRALEAQKTNTQTHDLGFKMLDSFGQGYRNTGDAYYRDVALASARSLATRYDSRVGIIKCCDWNSQWRLPLVVDTMMNLELLLWGAANGGEGAWRTMAVNHALKTASDLVRADGSTFQVADYNPKNGRLRWRGTYQGYADSSTWARGQGWAIYGFTMLYRYTRDARMLATARKVADWWLAHVPVDMVSSWDYDAPKVQKDSSAAAIVAAGLLELSGYVDATAAQRYRDAALRTLDTLAGPGYLSPAEAGEAILLHGVANYPAGSGVDAGLVYGDYYLLEAVLRSQGVPAP